MRKRHRTIIAPHTPGTRTHNRPVKKRMERNGVRSYEKNASNNPTMPNVVSFRRNFSKSERRIGSFAFLSRTPNTSAAPSMTIYTIKKPFSKKGRSGGGLVLNQNCAV